MTGPIVNASIHLGIKAFLMRNLVFRRIPHGLISPRYLLPRQPAEVRIHRRLWLKSLPRIPLPVFLAMELILYLRWIFYGAWKATINMVRRFGPVIKEREGIRLSTQFRRVLLAALGACVPPFEFYSFKLYRTNSTDSLWDYVFVHEVAAFHQWRNRRNGKTGRSSATLGDKYRTAEILSRHGAPVVPVFFMTPGGGLFDPSAFFDRRRRLFLKPRYGSAGRDCYILEKDDSKTGFTVSETRAGMATDRIRWEDFPKSVFREPYIVQPFMQNHPDLKDLCETDDAITVRIITEMPDDKHARCFSAMIEIPGPQNNTPFERKGQNIGRLHIILPIDPADGKARSQDQDAFPLLSDEQNRTWRETAVKIRIPFWKQILESALTSHTLFRDVYAIAWDFIVTPDGPYILEGNTGWGVMMPQIVHGGMLREAQMVKGR